MTKIVNNYPQALTRAIFILLLSLLIDASVRFILETYRLVEFTTYSLPFSKERGALINIGLSTLYLFFKVGPYTYIVYALYAKLETHRHFKTLYLRIFLFMLIQLGIYEMIHLSTGEKVLPTELILITIITGIFVPMFSTSIISQQQKILRSKNH